MTADLVDAPERSSAATRLFGAVRGTLRALRDGTPAEKIDATASDEMMKRVTRNDDYARWMKDWL